MQPSGERLRAYFPVDSVSDLRKGFTPVCFTEGEKKALALDQRGFTAVGLGGVWCGTQPTADGGHELIPDLATIPWSGRTVYIVFDWDPKESTRAEVAAAGRRLAAALRAAGAAEVYVVHLPPGPDGTKQGIDDFLVSRGLPLPQRPRHRGPGDGRPPEARRPRGSDANWINKR